MGNLSLLKKYSWFDKFKPERLSVEVLKFKELNTEIAFLIRSLFFILFGYLLELKDILNPESILWALSAVLVILMVRFLQLKLSRLKVLPLLFVAPRGLITILLFLSIEPSLRVHTIGISMITQIILISALLMMFGMLFFSKRSQ